MGDARVRIVRVVSRLNVGGPAVHLVTLTVGLGPSRYDQRLVCGRESPSEGSMLDYARSHAIEPVVIPELVGAATLTPADLTAAAKLYRLFRRERPAIVETHAGKAGLLARPAARLAGVPVVIHTFHGHVLHGYFGPLRSWAARTMERSLARMTDCIIAVSQSLKDELIGHGVAPADKIEVVPLGFEPGLFRNCAVHRGEVRRELGLSESAPLVGIVGRIVPIKNHRLFLDAAAIVSRQEPAARFLVVGDGILFSDVHRYARELGIADRVHFTGWRRDLPRVYADLDVLAVSSNNEGTPVCVIEAMMAGCPVVATRVGGLPDLLSEGHTGHLVPPRQPEPLAHALLRVIRDPRAAGRLRDNARGVAQERFSVGRLTADMEQLYRALLARKLHPEAAEKSIKWQTR